MKWSNISLVVCRDKKSKIHISPFGSKTAFLILVCIVITQKFRQLMNFFTCPVSLVSSDLLSRLSPVRLLYVPWALGERVFPDHVQTLSHSGGISLEAAAPGGQNTVVRPCRRGIAAPSRQFPLPSHGASVNGNFYQKVH